jgi:hypothetical protein
VDQTRGPARPQDPRRQSSMSLVGDPSPRRRGTEVKHPSLEQHTLAFSQGV